MVDIAIGMYHLTLIGELHGQRVQNGFYFMDRQVRVNESELDSLVFLVNDFQEWFVEKMLLWANDEYHLLGCVGTTLYPHGGPMVELGPLTSTGAQGNGALPSYCSGVLAYRTAINLANFRGRSFLAGVSKDLCDAGRLTGGSLTQLQDSADSLLARYGSGGSSPRHVFGVFSPTRGRFIVEEPKRHYEYAPAEGFRAVTQIVARPVVYTQRKRLIGHGI